MNLKETNLFQVKTLSAKLAKQIQVIHLDWNKDSLHQQVWLALKLEKARPLGWVPGSAIGMAVQVNTKFWLIRWNGQYYWYVAPDDDANEIVQLYNHPGCRLEQLFIG